MTSAHIVRCVNERAGLLKNVELARIYLEEDDAKHTALELLKKILAHTEREEGEA